MTAAKDDLYVDQGEDWEEEYQLLDNQNRPIVLTGGSVTGKIRVDYGAVTTIETFTGTITDGDNGIFEISLTDTQTSGMPVDTSPGDGKRPLTKYIYDIEVTYPSGLKDRVLEGNLYLSPEVTT